MGQLEIRRKTADKVYISVEYVSHFREISRITETLIDTGATISFVGINIISGLKYNIDLDKLTLENLVGMYGITGAEPSRTRKQPKPKPRERIYAAWAVNLKKIIVDDIVINSPQVFIPLSFNFSAERKIANVRFERVNMALIGTDILRNYNYGVNIDESPIFTITTPTREIPPRNTPIHHLDFED